MPIEFMTLPPQPLARRNARVSHLYAMAVGDSLTNGNGDTQAVNDGGWRKSLGAWMLTAPLGCTIDLLGPNDNGFPNGKHDGVSGVTCQYHIDNLPGLLTGSASATQFILLMIGTNDCLFQANVISTALSQQAAVLATIRTTKPGIPVLMSTLTDSSDAGFHANIVGVNAGMPAMVAAENALGGKVTLWDGFSAVGSYATNPGAYYDGLHFTAGGGYSLYYAAIKNQVYNQITLF